MAGLSEHRRALWVLRHAKAVRDPPPGGTDHDRPLSNRGRADAEALGRRLGAGGDRFGLRPDLLPGLVLCSTARRTVETADLVLAGMTERPQVASRRALYGADQRGLLDELQAVDDEVTSVMLVGHNPTLEQFVLAVATPAGRPVAGQGLRAGPEWKLATCAVVVFGLPAARWREIAVGAADVLALARPPY